MKKYIFILIIFITSKVYSQTHFPDSNAIWNVNYINSVGTPTDEMLYGLKGDTLINDTLYNKLYALSDTILSVENLEVYIGGFRQEGQKVWFKPKYGNVNEFLLYDFAAQIRDTIWHNVGLTTEYDKGQTVLVFNSNYYFISVVLDKYINNGFEKYNVETGPFDKQMGFLWSVRHDWIDGIGSATGIFWQHYVPPLSNPYTKELGCFKHNDTVKYQSNLKCNKCFCSGFSGIDEKKNNPDWFGIFPNPAKNLLTIEVQKPYSKIVVEIMDEKGSIIYKKESLDSPIALNDLIHGVYFIKLSVDNETITKKIIIK